MATTHTLRKPVDSRYVHRKRQKMLVLAIALTLGLAGALALIMTGCGGGGTPGGSSPPPPPVIPAVAPINTADVDSIVQTAVNSVNIDMVVAVVDRAGFVLGVFRTANAPTTALGNFGQTQNANDIA